ncbi:hypothetical protein FRC14_003941 [Serendipita sp. 396]|nr:hypothetical protein FRC14_003941 [Serendipita sp. 396]KAG9053762.1 hypothetical protein FS842_007226 [Serendipita sp. 407]
MDASLRRGRSPTTSLFADGQSQRSTPPSVPPLLTNGLFESSSLHDGAGTNLAHVGATPESPTSLKQTKRKRLAKACDSCHRSKRR